MNNEDISGCKRLMGDVQKKCRQDLRHPEWIRSVRSIEDIPTAEQTEAIVGIIHSAIARNYPDVSMEALEDALDIRTALEALAAVMDVSGMQRVKPGDKSGEAEPVS